MHAFNCVMGCDQSYYWMYTLTTILRCILLIDGGNDGSSMQYEPYLNIMLASLKLPINVVNGRLTPLS